MQSRLDHILTISPFHTQCDARCAVWLLATVPESVPGRYARIASELNTLPLTEVTVTEDEMKSFFLNVRIVKRSSACVRACVRACEPLGFACGRERGKERTRKEREIWSERARERER